MVCLTLPSLYYGYSSRVPECLSISQSDQFSLRSGHVSTKQWPDFRDDNLNWPDKLYCRLPGEPFSGCEEWLLGQQGFISFGNTTNFHWFLEHCNKATGGGHPSTWKFLKNMFRGQSSVGPRFEKVAAGLLSAAADWILAWILIGPWISASSLRLQCCNTVL